MDLWDNLTGLCCPLGGESNPQHVHLNTAFKWQPALCQKELPGEAKHLNSTKKKGINSQCKLCVWQRDALFRSLWDQDSILSIELNDLQIDRRAIYGSFFLLWGSVYLREDNLRSLNCIKFFEAICMSDGLSLRDNMDQRLFYVSE